MGTKEYVVALDVAEAEFARMAEEMDLDIELDGMDEEERVDFGKLEKKIVGAIRLGLLVIDEKGQPVYSPKYSNGDPITFRMATGASFMAQDGKKKGRDVAKLYAVMADMTRTNEKRFSQMDGRDLKVCMAIANLFLAG